MQPTMPLSNSFTDTSMTGVDDTTLILTETSQWESLSTSRLSAIKTLRINECDLPENFTLQDCPQLEKLEFVWSPFAREIDLRGLQKLTSVVIDYCWKFNHRLIFGDNPELRIVNISACQGYMQDLDLSDLPALEQVGVSFKPVASSWPWVEPLTIERKDYINRPTSTSRACDEGAGALEDSDETEADGAIRIRFGQNPKLIRFVFQGYIRGIDISQEGKGDIVVRGWRFPPLDVKASLLTGRVQNLAEDKTEQGNIPLVQTILRAMSYSRRGGPGFSTDMV